MTYKVTFHDVGHRKDHWTVLVKAVTHHALKHAVIKRGCLTRTDLEFSWYRTKGTLYAAGRPVGTFAINPAAPDPT